jgi:hypothetical protein
MHRRVSQRALYWRRVIHLRTLKNLRHNLSWYSCQTDRLQTIGSKRRNSVFGVLGPIRTCESNLKPGVVHAPAGSPAHDLLSLFAPHDSVVPNRARFLMRRFESSRPTYGRRISKKSKRSLRCLLQRRREIKVIEQALYQLMQPVHFTIRDEQLVHEVQK